MLITADQIRAGRALKNWSQTDLADRTGLAVPTIANIELGKQMPGKNTIEKIIDAFLTGGIIFTARGVEKTGDNFVVIQGNDKYCQIMIDIQNLLEKGEEYLLIGCDDKRSPREVVEIENKLLEKGIKVKKIISEDNPFIQGSESNYRAVPKEDLTFSDVITVYKNKVAIVLSQNNPENEDTIVLIDNSGIAETFKKIFNFYWRHGKKITQSIDITNLEHPVRDKYSEKNLKEMIKKKGRK